jgi:hypothetical protein
MVVRHVFVRCMDGHYFLVADNAFCPIDGAYSESAEHIVRLLPTIGDGVTLAALARAGGPAFRQDDVLVAELPDTVAPPWLLRPWFEGDRDAR